MATSDQEIVRRAFEAFTTGDIDAVLDEIGQDLFQVFRVRDGKVVEYRIYAHPGEALESVGLAE